MSLLHPRRSASVRSLCLAAALTLMAAPLDASDPSNDGCDEEAHQHDSVANPTSATEAGWGTAHHDSGLHNGSLLNHGSKPALEASKDRAEVADQECDHCPTQDCSTDPGCDVSPSVGVPVTPGPEAEWTASDGNPWRVVSLSDTAPQRWKWPPKSDG